MRSKKEWSKLMCMAGVVVPMVMLPASMALAQEYDFNPPVDQAVDMLEMSPVVSIQEIGTIVNGDFETGDLSGWGLFQAGTTGGWYNYSGTVSPVSSHTISAPPQGDYAATSDQTGVGIRILYQDITLPATGKYDLSFLLYYSNWSGSFITPQTLSYDDGPNQQYRVDIIDPDAPITSVASADVLMPLFQTQVGDPQEMAPTLFTFDLAAFAGQTVRLRFAEVDNRLWFNGSVDDIKLVLRVIPVTIDIKPGSDENSINLCSNGAVPVAILGSETFDVYDINPDSLRLADAAVKVVGKRDKSLCSVEDVDLDGYDDLVCHFNTTELGNMLDGTSTSATVQGETVDGTPIEGSDSITIVKEDC